MVVAKAKNKLQGTILKKVGADTVVYPEIEMGSRVAKSLLATEFTDWIELSNDYSMVEIAVPKPWTITVWQNWVYVRNMELQL